MREVVACPAIETGSRLSSARVYRPRRSAKTLIHQLTRENLETYLADIDQGEDFSAQVPLHVEAAFREYLKCCLLGSYPISQIHFHVLVTDGDFSAGEDGQAEFCPAIDLDDVAFQVVQRKMRKRGLRWLQRHGHPYIHVVHAMETSTMPWLVDK